jgi:MFS family permease
MDAGQWRRCVRLSITEGALSTAMGTLLSGVFLTGFALSLGASALHIGVLAALPPLASTAQLFGARCLDAGVNRKTFCILSIAASRLVWTGILLIAILNTGSSSWALMALIGVVGVSSVLGSMGGVASLSWIRDLVPTAKRFGFLGLRSQVNTVLALVLSVAGALFIDWWATTHPQSAAGFGWVLGGAILCGLAAIPALQLLHDPGTPIAALGHRSASAGPLREPVFRRLVLFYVCWNLANNLAAPFFTLFMIENLRLPYWHITSLQAFGSIIGFIATPWWTALGQRIGTRRVVFLATLGDAFYPLCWILLSPSTNWALPLVFMFGAFNTPLAIGAHTLVMQLAPDDRAPSYLAVFNAIMGSVMGIAAIGGGYLAQTLASQHVSVGIISFGGLSSVFVLSFAGRLASLSLLRRVTISEPQSNVEPDTLAMPELAAG